MKGGTLQISWHGQRPILSVDFHFPSGLLATGGADNDIKLWSLHRLEKSKSLPSATFKASLAYHSSTVNVVRFSPSGDLLASGADGGELLLWRYIQTNGEIPSWKFWKALRFHHKDVLDLGWSPDGTFIVSGSVDNTSIIWNVMKGDVEQLLADHQHYVQGVTWDPIGKYIASLSGDRTCRMYSPRLSAKKSKSKEKHEKRVYTCQHVLCKKDAPGGALVLGKVDSDEVPQKQVSSPKQYLFYDENMPSFFRRLSWSPDGSFLLLPSGVEKQSAEAAPCSVSYIVSRNDLSRPAVQLPASGKPVVATRFCPIVFSLSSKKSWKHDTNLPGVGVFKMSYRLVFAVATLDSVFVYDTEQSCPIAIFAGLHLAPITDLAWSSDAKFLAVSSQDGYCSLVGFDEGDLGTPVPLTDLPSNVASLMHGSQTANTREDPRPLSPLKCSSEKTRDVSLPEPDTLQRILWPEKDPVSGQATVLSARKSLGKQPDNQQRPEKIRRINPKPIMENLQEPFVSAVDTCVSTGLTGGTLIEESLLSDSRRSQIAAEVLVNAPQGQSGIVRCTADSNKLSDLVPSSEKASREGPSACQAVYKEPSAFCQTCSVSKEASDDIYADETNHSKMNCSRINEESVAESTQGPTTPLCQEHTIGLVMSLPTFQKPRDQYADTYVRPLKFRRISPNIVPDDLEKNDILKPVATETSLASSNACPGLQPG